jgi:DNA polymerase IV
VSAHGPGEAHILHADLDSFYASVEQRDHPELRGRPVIVGGGVVLAASYQAKAFGVRTAMSGWEARRLCPQAVVVAPRMAEYTAASRAVFEVFAATTPLVEGLSIDEAFLDVGGLWRIVGSPRLIAQRLRAEVASRVGLPITVGVARTKFLAKVASRVAKPDGLLVVSPERELEFLHPLPVRMLWGVGAITAGKLHDVGIRTVGEVAALPEPTLVSLLGPAAGRSLHALSNGRDARPVRTGVRSRSMGAQRALGRARCTPEELDATLIELVERVTRRMRAAGRPGRTVTLRLRFADYARVTRSHTLPGATVETAPVLAIARALLDSAAPLVRRRGLTLVGISVSNLGGDGSVQLTLPFPGPTLHLDTVLDQVTDRFGGAAIGRATLLGRAPGLEMPRLPD